MESTDTNPLFAAVVLDRNLTRPLDYSIPPEWQKVIRVGMRVEVPFRRGTALATIVALKSTAEVPHVKAIARMIPSGVSGALWKLAEWMAQYYCAPMQKTLKCFVPPNLRKETEAKKEFVFHLQLTKEQAIATITECRAKKPLHAEILEKLLAKSANAKELGATPAILKTLLTRKWIRREEKPIFSLAEEDFFQSAPKALNPEQKEAFQAIASSLEQDRFKVHLIHGVTGSGKTEIYLQAIATALERKKSAIMLVPEISLTSQTIERFRARFQEKIAIWHHRRSLGERAAAWTGLQTGEVQIVIGARSAIFCPAQNLGLIIVDEEHDSSYKQAEEPPCYHARDVAILRGSLENAVVLLGSATPSIESRYNAEMGKYILHRLTVRAGGAPPPSVRIVDMKRAYEVAGGFTHFSEELIDALKKRLEAGEQSLLFLNKRGYRRSFFCGNCRHIAKCPHCDLSLTFHKSEDTLRCHLCDYHQIVPRSCPSCDSRETLEFRGFGTEHVERALHALLPGVRTLRMDRDTTRKKESHEELYKQFRSHKADVLIGTQMIAKGFHFPAATLVGVLHADAGLTVPDFRSAEIVFQLLAQVAGRAGRAELPGEVIFQTFLPDHPLLALAKTENYETFYAQETEERKLFGYPPFCRLIKITVADTEEKKAEEAAKSLYAQVEKQLPTTARLLPVLPAGHAKIKDLYRFQFLIKTLKIKEVAGILAGLHCRSHWKIDVDPSSTFF